MSKELVDGFNNEELAQKIDWEGLEYFFLDYIGADDILDPELRDDVIALNNARNNIESILRENGALL